VSFSKTLAGSTAASDWALTIAGVSVAVSAASISGAEVVLTTASDAVPGDTVTLDYTGTTLQDSSTRTIATFAGQGVHKELIAGASAGFVSSEWYTTTAPWSFGSPSAGLNVSGNAVNDENHRKAGNPTITPGLTYTLTFHTGTVDIANSPTIEVQMVWLTSGSAGNGTSQATSALASNSSNSATDVAPAGTGKIHPTLILPVANTTANWTSFSLLEI